MLLPITAEKTDRPQRSIARSLASNGNFEIMWRSIRLREFAT
jgi:hypothetical protein